MTDSSSSSMRGPYAGYESIDEAIEALRRARFQVAHHSRLTGLGLVLIGNILDGYVAPGMVVLAPLEGAPNILTPLVIRSVEGVTSLDHPVGLMLGDVSRAGLDPNFSSGIVLDVLERDPSPPPPTDL